MQHEPNGASGDAHFDRRTFLVAIAGLASTAALGAVAVTTLPSRTSSPYPPLPTYVYATPRSVKAYRTALANAELLQGLACYCGCVSYSPPHRSLRDCFLQPQGGFEAHAAGCTVCQDEALDAARLLAAGLPPADVRQRIDADYRSRGPSTDGAALPA